MLISLPSKMTDQLKTQAVSGVKWNALSMVVMTVFQFTTLAVLARLLSPSDFGLMGMIMIVVGFTQAFADMGLSNAIIQRQEVPEEHLSTFFWMNILTGIGLFVCLVLIRPLVVLYFKEPELSIFLIVAALSFLITPVGQIFTTLLSKELKFKTLSKVQITAEIIYSVSAIGFALAKFGVLSLIFGQLLRSVFTAAALFFVFRKIWLPRFHFHISDIQSYLRFGGFQMGERVINYLSSNIDYIIIGRLLGSTALGFYTLAYQLVIFPLTKINPVITKVAFPVFSKLQHEQSKMTRGYCHAIHYVSMLSFPMLTGMLVVAPEFIKLVYGPKWIPSILVLQILCMVGILKSLGNPMGSILLAKGRPDIGLYFNIYNIIIVSLAVVVGANWGIIGVAVALLLVHILNFFIFQSVINRLLALQFRQYFKVILSPFVCSSFMLAGIVTFKMLLNTMNELSLFLITVTLGIIIYFGSYYIRDKTVFLELKSMLRGS